MTRVVLADDNFSILVVLATLDLRQEKTSLSERVEMLLCLGGKGGKLLRNVGNLMTNLMEKV